MSFRSLGRMRRHRGVVASYAGSANREMLESTTKCEICGEPARCDMAWSFGRAGRSGLMTMQKTSTARISAGLWLRRHRDGDQFNGPLVGSSLVGLVQWRFVKGAGHSVRAPHGVIGNFRVGNSNWKASGIYGGKLNGQLGAVENSTSVPSLTIPDFLRPINRDARWASCHGRSDALAIARTRTQIGCPLRNAPTLPSRSRLDRPKFPTRLARR